LNYNQARSAADEVVGTHFSFTGNKKASYIEARLPEIWAHLDVNNDGFLPANKGPVLLKMLLGDVESNNGL